MSKRLEISREAVRDLDEIWDFIAKDSVGAADRFIDELFSKCCEIAELEGIGRKRDELLPGLLSLAHKRYVIFFQRRKSLVWIVRILNGAKDVERVFYAWMEN